MPAVTPGAVGLQGPALCLGQAGSDQYHGEPQTPPHSVPSPGTRNYSWALARPVFIGGHAPALWKILEVCLRHEQADLISGGGVEGPGQLL
jgi:hypothetical protein